MRYGASPRGLQAVILAAKIRALLEGRYAVAIDDIRHVARARAAPPHDPQLRGRGRRRQGRHDHRRDPEGDEGSLVVRPAVSGVCKALSRPCAKREPRRGSQRAVRRAVLEDARAPAHGVAQGVLRQPARRAPHAQGRLAASSSPITARTRAAMTFATSTGTSTAGSTSCCCGCSKKKRTSTSTSSIDVSDSMSIGSPLPKLHYAMQVGAALTYVGLANLDRVSIVPFGDKLIDRLPPSRGKNRIFRVFEFLRNVRHRRQDRARRVHEGLRRRRTSGAASRS